MHIPWWRSRWVQAGGSLAVVALIFGFLFPKVADYSEVWTTITAMNPLERSTLLALALWNLAAYWPMLTAAAPLNSVPPAGTDVIFTFTN